MPQNVDISSYWSEIYLKIVSEFHSLPIKRAIHEKLISDTDTEKFTAITFSEPDLGVYCIKNYDLLRCQKTLDAITLQMNVIVKFNRNVCRKSDDLRKRIISDLIRMLSSASSVAVRFPPKVYGSFENELCCYESNINIHVGNKFTTNLISGKFFLYVDEEFLSLVFQIPEYHHPDSNGLWRQIYKKFLEKPSSRKFFDERMEPDASNMELLFKMIHKETAVETVISYTNPMRLNNSMLMNIYLNLNSNLKPLVIYLKHILVLHELHGDDKISTYQLFWLLVYYFQRKRLLPAVKDIRSIVGVPKCYIDNKWNCSVPHLKSVTFNSTSPIDESAASLFLGFVQFYKNFDFLRYVISPYVGHSIPLEEFDTCLIPMDAADAEKLSGIFEKIAFIKSAANFQDPTILDRNLFSSVPTQVINSFKYLCKYLHHYYYTAVFEENDFHINLPVVLPNPAPVDLIEYTSIILDVIELTTSCDLNCNVVIGIRLLMEDLLKFTLVRMKLKIERKINTLVSVVYFDYRIDSETCDDVASLIINRIIKPVSGNVTNFIPQRVQNEKFKIHIVCEIFDKENVILLIEGTACFIDFFNALGSTLLNYVIKRASQNYRCA